MKEYIKILDDLRPEDIRFNFDLTNKNLCFGGGGGGGALPKVKFEPPPIPKLKVGGTLGEALDAGKAAGESAADATKTNLATGADAGKAALHAAADAGKTNLHTAADAGKAFAHEAADQFKAGMQKLGLHKKDDPGSDDAPGSSAIPGGTEKVGGGGSKIAMKQAESAKGKKAKMGAKGKRSLRKVGVQ